MLFSSSRSLHSSLYTTPQSLRRGLWRKRRHLNSKDGQRCGQFTALERGTHTEGLSLLLLYELLAPAYPQSARVGGKWAVVSPLPGNSCATLGFASLGLSLVSYYCWNKVPQTHGLKQHKLIVLQFWRSNSETGLAGLKLMAVHFWRLQGRNHSLPFPAFRECSSSLAPGHITLTSASNITSFLTLTHPVRRTLVIISGPPGYPRILCSSGSFAWSHLQSPFCHGR